jgi:hypothetical protein
VSVFTLTFPFRLSVVGLYIGFSLRVHQRSEDNNNNCFGYFSPLRKVRQATPYRVFRVLHDKLTLSPTSPPSPTLELAPMLPPQAMDYNREQDSTSEDWSDWDYLQKNRKLDLSAKDLQILEVRRREILGRVGQPFWRILRYWEGTCLRVLSRDYLVWGCMLLYGVVRVQAHLNTLPGYIQALGSSNVDVIGGFLSFFLVLFCNQSNQRFYEQYKCSMNCLGRLNDLSGFAVTGLPLPNALRIVRYMNAAHVVGYIGLSDTYTEKNLFNALNPSRKMLTDDEVRRVSLLDMNNSSDAFRELTTWTLKEIMVAQQQGLIDGRFAGEMRSCVLNFRGAMESIYVRFAVLQKNFPQLFLCVRGFLTLTLYHTRCFELLFGLIGLPRSTVSFQKKTYIQYQQKVGMSCLRCILTVTLPKLQDSFLLHTLLGTSHCNLPPSVCHFNGL